MARVFLTTLVIVSMDSHVVLLTVNGGRRGSDDFVSRSPTNIGFLKMLICKGNSYRLQKILRSSYFLGTRGLKGYPPGNDHISPPVKGTFESMIFRTSQHGIF